MCVSTGNAGTPNACAITTLAVLWPTPASFSSASKSAARGRRARRRARAPIAARFFALRRRQAARADERQDLRGASSVAIARGVGRAREQRGRDHVDARVGALRGQDHRDEQLERIAVIERDRGRREQLVEDARGSSRRAPGGRADADPRSHAAAVHVLAGSRPLEAVSASARASWSVASASTVRLARLRERGLAAGRGCASQRASAMNARAFTGSSVLRRVELGERFVRRHRARAGGDRAGSGRRLRRVRPRSCRDTRARRRRRRRAGATCRPRAGSSRTRPPRRDRRDPRARTRARCAAAIAATRGRPRTRDGDRRRARRAATSHDERVHRSARATASTSAERRARGHDATQRERAVEPRGDRRGDCARTTRAARSASQTQTRSGTTSM